MKFTWRKEGGNIKEFNDGKTFNCVRKLYVVRY